MLACLVVVLSTAAFIIYNLGLKTKEANATVWLGSLVLGTSCLASYVPVAADPWLTAQYVVSVGGCGFVCVRLVRARAFRRPVGIEWGTLVAAAVAAMFVGLDAVGWVPLSGIWLDRVRVLVPGAAAVLVSFPLCIAAWHERGTRYPWLLWSLGNLVGAANITESDGLTCAVLLYIAFAMQNAWIGCGSPVRNMVRRAVRAIQTEKPRASGALLFFAKGARQGMMALHERQAYFGVHKSHDGLLCGAYPGRFCSRVLFA